MRARWVRTHGTCLHMQVQVQVHGVTARGGRWIHRSILFLSIRGSKFMRLPQLIKQTRGPLTWIRGKRRNESFFQELLYGKRPSTCKQVLLINFACVAHPSTRRHKQMVYVAAHASVTTTSNLVLVQLVMVDQAIGYSRQVLLKSISNTGCLWISRDDVWTEHLIPPKAAMHAWCKTRLQFVSSK